QRQPTLGPQRDLLYRLGKVVRADQFLALARGQERRLVRQVAQVRADQAGRLRGDGRQVDRHRERYAAGVHLENLRAPSAIRRQNGHVTVEAPGAKDGRVEDVGAVRRCQDDDRFPRVEAVHLDQELVERLLALLVAPELAPAAPTGDRVELVDEDDRRGGLPGLGGELADPRRAHRRHHTAKL